MKSPVLKSTAQRRLAIAALLLVPTLSACGFGAQTDQPYQAAAGPNYRSGDVWVLNAVIVSGKPGSGTFAGTLVNKTDKVVQVGPVTGDGITSATGGNETLLVPADGPNNLGEAGDTVPPAKLTIAGSPDAITPGKYVTLNFTFSTGSEVTMSVPVLAVGDDYAAVPLPVPTPAKGTKPGKGGKASGTPTSTDTPTAE